MAVPWQALAVVLLAGALAAGARAGGIDPHVTTGGSVDCRSVASIVRDVCAGKRTDQDKAIALFQFARRLMFPWPNRVDPAARHDTLHLLNTYGYSFCSQQALLTVHLWQAAGIKGGVWAVPGHSTMQAEYAGGLHWFDLLIGAYVFGRDGKTIAALGDIARDRTILTQAAAEGRAPRGFLPERTVLKDDAARFCKHDPKYIQTCADHVDDLTFMANLAPVAEPWRWGGPSPSRYRPEWHLRRGERVVFLWDFLPDEANCNVLAPGAKPRAYWVAASELPPNHFYGAAAQQRDVNWEHFRPYVKTVNGVKTGRYAANGRQVYEPDLRRMAEGDAETNSFRPGGAAGPALGVARPGVPSELVVRMRTPHVYTGGTVSAGLRLASGEDVARIHVRRGPKGKWVAIWDAAGAEGRGPGGKVRAAVRLEKHVRGARDVAFKFECNTKGKAGEAGLEAIRVEAIFQHNMFARPYLLAGRNEVAVRVGGAEALKAAPLTVTYKWMEGATEKTHARRIAASPASYAIDVGGAELPRMLSLELAVGR